MKHLKDVALAGKRVLVRVDINVPFAENGHISDDSRIQQVLPTLEYIRKEGGRLILAAHRGRPQGQVREEYRLAPVAAHLAGLIDAPVAVAPDCVGTEVEGMVAELAPGAVLMLENLRFHPEETANDPDFSAALGRLADVYVNDAFAASHRAHASVVGVVSHVAERAAGFLLAKELDFFNRAMENPARPLVAIVGGAKVSTKIGALEHMLERVDKMIIGGAMANTFLKSHGADMGGSLVEDDLLDTARTFLTKAGEKGVKVYLPVDFVAASHFGADAATKTVTCQDMVPQWLALDIGPATAIYFTEALADARTIVWNGPLGAFEMAPFARGTMAVCHAVAAAHALTVTGGGDINAAIQQAGVAAQISYMSTGGGAFLRLMEGKSLPGVDALLH
ncbi:MAG: phosphoglycerate kinase [Desulfofustis sp. PB-SRB1]|jgi:phosphoglycerate kinase|nr:phosphoglycerate kinase [Desulfofustis sp. PB-SRB1]MBM1000813.1 phosphoglycerate kinase [Desulfofustis sp. PB-SRB1]HBH27862.1 phosphoglycerate kinase [Desulfofustis sp.]HBH32621.1 phosphoglycerate kinase [Desulfofustis sp.]